MLFIFPRGRLVVNSKGIYFTSHICISYIFYIVKKTISFILATQKILKIDLICISMAWLAQQKTEDRYYQYITNLIQIRQMQKEEKNF